MKVPLGWLERYVDLQVGVEELAHRLSMAGAEVEAIERSAGDWEHVVVGRVAQVSQHPDADRLRLATVEYGAGEPLTVVCGAPNLAEGQTVAFAQVGARLIDAQSGETRKLKRSKIRGVQSMGMVCSERELGISDEHEGILVLETDAPPGTPLAEAIGQVSLDVKPTPNRPDHFSILGIAREVAALTGANVREPEIACEESPTPAAERTSVRIEDPVGCPRYAAAIIENVRVAPSPAWLQEALSSAGLRPINNVVDVTNFVLMEYGQPLHAFDYERLTERRIVVRRAAAGEQIGLLDGSTLELDAADLVIADAERPVALAGIMGGADSEVSDATATVLLESANFEAASIRRSGARHKLRTEASLRFEKSLNPELAELAARRAARLIAEVSGGSVCAGLVDEYPAQAHAEQVITPVSRIRQLLAVEPSVEEVRGVLESLGIPNRWLPPDRYAISCPPWRTDLSHPDDVVEEIGRIIGYDRLPSAPLHGSVPEPDDDADRALAEHIRDALAALGCTEIITYPMTDAAELETAHAPSDALALANPMNSEAPLLRTSLRPAMLRAFARGWRAERSELRMFEIGKAFLPHGPGQPEERRILMIAIGGEAAQGIHAPSRELDFFDAKGLIEGLADALGTSLEVTPPAAPIAGLAPSESADIKLSEAAVGSIGKVTAEMASAFDLERPAYLVEIALHKLSEALEKAGGTSALLALSQYPPVVEDLALAVDEHQPAGELRDAILDHPLVESAELFDLYSGPPIPDGLKSLAYRVVYRAPNRTLEERDVERARRSIVARLEKQFSAHLRDQQASS